MLTDTHCHLDDQSYQNDLEEVLKNAYNLGFILNDLLLISNSS